MDAFTCGYLECAAWTASDEKGGPIDDEEFAPEAIAQAEQECKDFQSANADLLRQFQDAACCGDDDCGHDFWLTRNGHGTGYWDRTKHESGQQLTDACKLYGTRDVYVGDDHWLYFQ